MFAWIIKMLLKIAKPFAKMAIFGALFSSLIGDEEETAGDTENASETPAE